MTRIREEEEDNIKFHLNQLITWATRKSVLSEFKLRHGPCIVDSATAAKPVGSVAAKTISAVHCGTLPRLVTPALHAAAVQSLCTWQHRQSWELALSPLLHSGDGNGKAIRNLYLGTDHCQNQSLLPCLVDFGFCAHELFCSQTDRQTDSQTDSQPDRQTDRMTI